jgi:two-component SAPR family response regulator
VKILLVDDEESALRDLSRLMSTAVSDAEIQATDQVDNAIELCRETDFDVAFLDINMPGSDGLTLAKKLKRLRPMINIVIVSAYPEYAMDALKIYVSDYILKPALPKDIKQALGNLRNPVKSTQRGLYVQCFGNFEAFFDGKPLHFGRTKVKELFAYLIDRRGASSTNAELRAILWQDGVNDSKKQRKYFAQIVFELIGKLEELGLSDILVHRRDSYAFIPEKISCDYYLALKQDPEALSRYEGEYMSQYEWANHRIGVLEEKLRIY